MFMIIINPLYYRINDFGIIFNYLKTQQPLTGAVGDKLGNFTENKQKFGRNY